MNRYSIGGRRFGVAVEIPLLLSFLYLFSKAESGTACQTSGTKRAGSAGARSALKTLSGGEFDWGGTSVKR